MSAQDPSTINLLNIINLIADPVFVKDDAYCFVVVNDALCSMLGMDRQDIIGKTLGESLPKDQMDHFLEVDKQVLASGQEDVREEKLTGKDQKILTIITKKTRYIDESGNKFVVGIIHDSTERKSLEVQLMKKQDELSMLLDAIPAWIFYKDTKNTFLRVNKSFCEAMESTKELMEGKSLFSLYPKEQADAFFRDDQEVIATGKAKMNIIESIQTQKGIRWVKTDKIPFTDDKGNIIGVIGFAVDITDQKHAEDEVKSHNEELEKMNRLMMGRELKMVELKNKIIELETK